MEQDIKAQLSHDAAELAIVIDRMDFILDSLAGETVPGYTALMIARSQVHEVRMNLSSLAGL